MDIIAYLICFTVVMINLFGRGEPNPIILGAALIGLSLSAIAGSFYEKGKNQNGNERK